MHAFRELATTRRRNVSEMGTIVGPIPWDKLALYLDRMELDDVNRDWMQAAIRALDNEYLDYEHARLTAEAKKIKDQAKAAAKGRR